MKRIIIPLIPILTFLAQPLRAAEPVSTHLTCEYRESPLGIDAPKPRLAWKIEDRGQSAGRARANSEKPGEVLTGMAEGNTEIRGQKQTAYQVLVASTPELLAKDQGDLWDSGKVKSDQSIQVEYAGKPPESRTYCQWKVCVWLNDGKAPAWRAPAFWSMGLVKPGDWQAKWVKAGGDPSPWLRKEFTLTAVPERATAFVNVKGNYELYINGKMVGDDVLLPAVTVYRKHTLCSTYDISEYLKPGTNCVGVWLGLGLSFIRKDQEHMPIARVQLDMSVAGERVVVGTDPTWTWMNSSHTESGWGWCGNGRESIDAGRYIDGWNEVGCTNGSWKPVEEFAEPTGVATAQACPPNRITKKFPMVKCTAMTPNMFELDFGTNLNGWFTLKPPKLEAGHKVLIRFADKRLQTAEEEKNSGVWKVNPDHGPAAYTTFNQQLEFTSAGKPGEQIWPKHNYSSFQYAIVEGLPAAPAPGDAEAMMVDSQGMTTFGEQWDGIWSQIHSCFASAGSWFYQGLAGICPDESGPGFKKIIIKPAVVCDLTSVKYGYDSIHGRIVSNWQRDGTKLTMDVTIPINTTATVYVPSKDAAGVTESGKPATEAAGVKFLRMENSAAVDEVGSGSYRFQSAVQE